MQQLRSNTAIRNATIITTAKVETSASAHAKHGYPSKTNSYASTEWLTENSQRSSSAPSQPFSNAATNSKSKMTNSRCLLKSSAEAGDYFLQQKNSPRERSIFLSGDPEGRAYFATQNTIPQGVASERWARSACFLSAPTSGRTQGFFSLRDTTQR